MNIGKNTWLLAMLVINILCIPRATLPGQWSLITISQYNHSFHPMFPTDHCRLVSIFCRKVRWPLRARIYAYNRHLSFDVAFICSTLTHCGVCDLSVWRLKWEVSYVHQSVWRRKWFSCQSSYVLQRLRLCRASDTVFRREIDSQRQWGYGTCYGDCFPAAKECTPVLFSGKYSINNGDVQFKFPLLM